MEVSIIRILRYVLIENHSSATAPHAFTLHWFWWLKWQWSKWCVTLFPATVCSHLLVVVKANCLNRGQESLLVFQLWKTQLNIWSKLCYAYFIPSLYLLCSSIIPSFLPSLHSILPSPGEGELAAAHYRQAVQLKPAHYVAMVNLGRLLRSSNENQEAESWFKRSEKLFYFSREVWFGSRHFLMWIKCRKYITSALTGPLVAPLLTLLPGCGSIFSATTSWSMIIY